MNPFVRYRLRHIEHLSKDILGRAFSQVYQNEHQFVLHVCQRTILILHVTAMFAFLSFQRVGFHPLQKTSTKYRQQRLEFFKGVSG